MFSLKEIWSLSMLGMSRVKMDLCWSISVCTMSTNVDTLITLYFYVCRWKLKKMKTIEAINKKFIQITQVRHVARALEIVPRMSDHPYILDVNASCGILWNICLWKSDILYNVLDIVSQLKNNGLPISVKITCMLTF